MGLVSMIEPNPAAGTIQVFHTPRPDHAYPSVSDMLRQKRGSASLRRSAYDADLGRVPRLWQKHPCLKLVPYPNLVIYEYDVTSQLRECDA